EPVHAKLIEPVFAFDRVVLPAGSEVSGNVVRLDPVGKMQRTKAVLGGDFTPLHVAEVQFTDIALPDGRHFALATAETPGLASIYSPPLPKKNPKKADEAAKSGDTYGVAKSTIETHIISAIH